MSKFKVGDKVKVAEDFETWLQEGMTRDTVLTIIDEHDFKQESWVNADTDEIEIEGVNSYPEDFVKVVTITKEQTVRSDNQVDGGWYLNKDGNFAVEGLGLGVPSVEELGVYRPDVAERKADKIRMELFDDGFPNAVLEIAKVMTWAQKVKGYKDHDWVNLPDAENSLKGAASRHRRDANGQKMSGIAANERVDHESKLHHLAHSAFNVLAELELILTGKIK